MHVLYWTVPYECAASAPNTVCTYSCGSGYVQTGGNASRTCSLAGTWGGSDIVCSVTPPTMVNQVISVYEVGRERVFSLWLLSLLLLMPLLLSWYLLQLLLLLQLPLL